MSCRTCAHAYLRVAKTRDYGMEACGLGILPMVPFLEGTCRLWAPADAGLIAERERYGKPPLFWGAELEYPE